MAETPKGDTASPSGDPGPTRPEDAQPEHLAPGDVLPDDLPSGDDAKSSDAAGDTIAGDTGADSLTAESAHPDPADGPWKAAAGGGGTPPVAAEPRPAGLRRMVIGVFLVVLVAGGAYASYPMWRSEIEPVARSLGIELPVVRTSEAPTPKPAPAPVPPVRTEAPAPADQTRAADKTPTPVPAPPASVANPSVSGEIDRLADRLGALGQRLAAIEAKPAEPAADAATVARMESRIDEMSQSLTAVTDEMAIVREGLATSGGGEGLGPMAAQLSERLQGLSDRMQALEEAPSAPAVAPERLDALQGRVAALSDSIDQEVRKSAEDLLRLETRLSSIEGRLDQIAKALESTRSGRERAGAFLLAANQLAATTATSAGFAIELEALRTAAPANAEISATLDALAGHSSGVPSLAVLRDRFARTAAGAVDASVVGSGEGLIGQALTRVASLVTIRRTATGSGDGLDAALVQAETALAAGDLAAAIAALKPLDGDPAKAVAPWLADAEARAAVDAAVRLLQARALAGVAGG